MSPKLRPAAVSECEYELCSYVRDVPNYEVIYVGERGGVGNLTPAGWTPGNITTLVYPLRRLLWQRGQRLKAAAWPLEIQCLQVRHVTQLASAMSAPEAIQTC